MNYQLESLEQMHNYYGWVFDELSPFMGRRVLEIGAGSGNFSRMLLKSDSTIDHIWLVEPNAELAAILAEQFAGRHNVKILQLSAEDLDHSLLVALNLDTIIMINVLEHIENDVDLLRRCSDALQPEGKLLTFSPAFPLLYSHYDRLVGHFRRYTKKEIHEKFVAAGFKMHYLKYFNTVGLFAWLLLMRFMKLETFGDNKLKLYEKMIGWIRMVEQRFNPPFGQNLIAVGVVGASSVAMEQHS